MPVGSRSSSAVAAATAAAATGVRPQLLQFSIANSSFPLSSSSSSSSSSCPLRCSSRPGFAQSRSSLSGFQSSLIHRSFSSSSFSPFSLSFGYSPSCSSIASSFCSSPSSSASPSSSSPSSGASCGFNIGGTHLEGRSVYLDMQATTPLDPRVLDAMLPFSTSQYGNPHSRTHHFGWESEQAVETARAQVASLIGADPKEIVFTSGATESNNAVIKGIAHFYGKKKKHLITTQTEHKCVLDSFRSLQAEGFTVSYLPVQKDGLLSLTALEECLKENADQTSLVSVMAVNNEIGVIQPLAEIAKLAHQYGAFFHTDAAQACGKIPVDVSSQNIDLLSISGHKLYGPKGIGAMYVRRRPRVRLTPILSGGGQERGFRSGTLPAPLVVGLGEAAAIAQREMELDHRHVSRLSKMLYDGITAKIPKVVLNGHPLHRYPGNLNLSFSYVEGESLLMALKEVAVSSGSACTSASLEPSYVLRALGVEEDMAHTSIRFGIGRFTTEREIQRAIELCVKHVERLREMSPLWEMVQNGIDLKTIKWTN